MRIRTPNADADVERASGEPMLIDTLLLRGACILRRPSTSTVVEGEDSLGLLDRLFTQSLSDMKEMEVRRSFLCDALGRAIDHLLVWRLEGQILIIGLDGRGDELRSVLSESVSWKDDISITVGDDAIADLWLIGDAGIRCLVGMGIDSDDMHPSQSVSFGPAFVAESESIEGHPSYRLVMPSDALNTIVASLVYQGATEMLDADWEQTRIGAGILGGNEVDGTTIPFELGAFKDVSLSKGCYPGQEILARMESRGKLARTLKHLRSDTPLNVGRHEVEDGRPIEVTSSARLGDSTILMALCHPSQSPPINLADGTTLVSL